MAENPKRPHALPPLADKGAARPLAQTRPGESAAAATAAKGDERRPSGLHTRPDLFGSSAVMPRPDDDLAEESDKADPQHGNEDKANDPAGEPQSDAAGTAAPGVAVAAESSETDPAARIGRPSQADRTLGGPAASARSGSPVGVFLPVANLQDHPLQIPESISFEDWPNGPDGEPEDGARSPEGASMESQELEAQEPETEKPESQEPESAEPTPGEPEPGELAFADGPAEAAMAPDWSAFAFEEDPGRLKRLLAWLGSEGEVRRFIIDKRWLLPAGIASCAVLLVAGLAIGMIPIPGDDRKTAQLAQDGGAPASGDLAASEAGQQDVPVAPAGDSMGNDSAAGPQPDDGPGAATGDQPVASQLAALPEPGAPATIDRNREPIVDFMRIDPDGKAVVAGRAAPGTELTVLDNGEPLGTITADIYGLWTFVSKEPLASGRHEIGLRVKRQGSEVGRKPVLVTDSGSPLPLDPEATAGTQDPVTGAPDRQAFPQDLPEDVPQDLRAAKQLAAVAPETPVQSDASAPRSPGQQADTAAEDRVIAEIPAQPAETAAATVPAPAPAATTTAEPVQAVEQGAGKSEPAAENTATPPIATATSTVPAPAPKPEPPDETQIAAAAPAGGDYVIQFASFLSPETAVREQGLVEEQFSDLLAGHEIFVQQADIADQGTFYRVRLGPFASLAEARATCARFQERDRDCLAMAR